MISKHKGMRRILSLFFTLRYRITDNPASMFPSSPSRESGYVKSERFVSVSGFLRGTDGAQVNGERLLPTF
jgi:hypothetical protein